MMHAQLLQRPATGRLQFVDLAKGRLGVRMLMPRSVGSGDAGMSPGPVAPVLSGSFHGKVLVCLSATYVTPRDRQRPATGKWKLLDLPEGPSTVRGTWRTYVPLLDVFGCLDLETMRSPKEDAQAGPHADAQCEPLPNPPRALNPYTQSPNPSPRPLNQTPYALSPSPRP